jgi:pimeloyl-ACP methyl ester carboxylesterase
MRLRNIVRLLFFIVLLLLVGPYLVPLPPVGVEAVTLADPGGYFVDIDGLQTYVLERGPKDGEPVLFLHGWGASTLSWRNNMDAVVQAGYRAIAYDRPPYGLSAKTGAKIPYSAYGQMDFMLKLMDKLGLQRPAVVGSSAGGVLAGYFAVWYPGRISKLVFVDGVPRPTDDAPDTSSGGTSARLGGALGMPAFVTGLLNFPPVARWAQIGIRAFLKPDFASNILQSAYFDPSKITPEVAQGYQRPLQVIGWDEALLGQLSGSPASTDPISAQQIASIQVPVMITWGEEDTWFPIEAGQRVHQLLPNAIWLKYPNTGHLPMEESAEAFNRDLLSFLKSNTVGEQS